MPIIYIKWDDSFSVKVGEIDRQHVNLVNMINDLSDAMRQGKGKDTLGKIISGWLQNHIKGADKKYGPFLNEKGLK